MQCQTNLRNLVVACQSHEAARQAFPYTATRYRDHDGVDHPTICSRTSTKTPSIKLSSTITSRMKNAARAPAATTPSRRVCS